jgi:predicted nucleic-acid-binding protein
MAKQANLNTCALDTNILLRWLLGDVLEQQKVVEELLESKKKVYVHMLVVAEMVWVMHKLYLMDRTQVCEGLKVLISHPKFIINRELLTTIVQVYPNKPKLSFVDLVLSLEIQSLNYSPLYTFDKKLANQVEGVELIS